ncbi:Pimeloyl-ACP methyl ester carboxylesterase [Rhizobiales bacterium GAS113]|jgi:pimeloyl-ACP methyl ester carboxylesterase|nr:Pimeloyl-ACP methyl ester carboxylesterase [Rhizobiales bacterium GAS113]
MSVTPFTIAIPETEIAELRRRLRAARWPDQPTDAGWELGTDIAYLRELVAYWGSGFDWRAREAELNRLPQFKMELDGIAIHFVHAKAKGGAGLPLVLTHGWPGSFAEFAKLIPMLTDPAAHGGEAGDAFDVVVPSLPGYGFSDRPTRLGYDPSRIADLWAALMMELGYRRFAAQGGDWGAAVTTALGLRHQERLIGLHFNYIPGSFQIVGEASEFSEDERASLARRAAWAEAEGGYAHVQRTRPQSLAYALNDSPVGLAGWIAEKFRVWTDCGGEIERAVTRDELLTDISIYWFTQTISSSIRLYYEVRNKPLRFQPGEKVQVPCAIAHFPKEIPLPARSLVERAYDLRRWTEMPRGGHFAALEQPELLAEDIRAFFRPLRSVAA